MKLKSLEKSSWLITLAFFIPGVFLTIVPAYYLGKVMYTLVMWDTAKGVVTEFVDDPPSDEDTYFVKFSFTDSDGERHISQTANAVGTENREIGEYVRVFYDPGNPTNAHPGFLLLSYGLITIFFPFGLLLIYLGWPFHKLKE